MPKGNPLIRSEAVRSLMIGASMVALLTGSLALAWGLTGVPILPPRSPEPDRFEAGPVSVVIPSAWQLESVAAGADQQPRRWYFVNAVSPAERLRIERYETPTAIDPQQVLNALMIQQQLVAGLIFNRGETKPIAAQTITMDQGEAIDTFFAIERNSRVQTSPQLHAVRLFTPDRKRYWLFHLIDQVPRERYTPQVEAGHREQLRRIANTLEYAPQ